MKKFIKCNSGFVSHVKLFCLAIVIMSFLPACMQDVNGSVDVLNDADTTNMVKEDSLKLLQDVQVDTNITEGEPTANQPRKIQVCLIMDTSGSMEGLIEQAKSQLWATVSELIHVKYRGESPILEIALYEYGNDNISSGDGWVSQILPFSTDLDVLSASLFALKTNGGEEYCGLAIQSSLDDLKWSDSSGDIKTIFIAGNEPFTQGPYYYEKACGNARAKGVVVNTIHCGDINDGVEGKWKSGALIGGGDFMSIDYNRTTVYVATPYDDQINKLGSKLNETYITYNSNGSVAIANMSMQDANASNYSSNNMASRNVIKSSQYYDNSSWDLVDAYNSKKVKIKKVEKEMLPVPLREKSEEELEKYVVEQSNKRKNIQKQIHDLNIKREKYYATHKTNVEENLQSSMVKALKKQVISKNYTW